MKLCISEYKVWHYEFRVDNGGLSMRLDVPIYTVWTICFMVNTVYNTASLPGTFVRLAHHPHGNYLIFLVKESRR